MRPTDQINFGFAPVIVPKGDGSFTITPGKPVQWLKTKPAARALGLGGSTLRQWIQEGVLPQTLPDGTEVFRNRGVAMYEFNLGAVQQIRDRWTQERLR
jgi:hypothetical protein